MARGAFILFFLALAALVFGAPVPLPKQKCYAGAYMLVARGSLEAVGRGKVGAVADAIAERVPNSASVAIDYPAGLLGNGTFYPLSVYQGIMDTHSKIQSYAKACGPKSKIVLIGYSQGGNVITDSLAGGWMMPPPLASELKQFIKGVIVFGDPTFTAKQSFDAGSATTNGFIESREDDELIRLNTYAPVLRSYCDIGDPVCAGGFDFDVHYAEVQSHAEEAVDFISGLFGY